MIEVVTASTDGEDWETEETKDEAEGEVESCEGGEKEAEEKDGEGSG